MANKTGMFRVMHEDGKGHTVYYKKGNMCFCYTSRFSEKYGVNIFSPTRRIANKSYEVAKQFGQEF